MTVIYENIALIAGSAFALGVMTLEIPRRQRHRGRTCHGDADRPRLLVPLADRLLRRLAAVPLVVLPLLSAAVVVLAFVHGVLNEIELGLLWRVIATEGPVLDAVQWVFTLIYCGVAALVIAGVGFLLHPGPELPRDRAVRLLVPRSDGLRPWLLRRGGWRRVSSRACALGSWLCVAGMVMLVPSLQNLMFAILGAEDAAAAAQAIADSVPSAP